jgi:polyisoprenoid-binding protein YceI
MNLKTIFFASFLITGVFTASAQDLFITKTAKVNFDCTPANPVENIDAVNNEATSILNKATGDLVFQLLVKSFRFEKALMEEHFNENYMESGKFPKADFKGKISNLSNVNFAKDGDYPVKAAGNFTLHGITKPITVDGTISIKGGKIHAKSKFSVKLEDYKIDRPKVVADKIAEKATITIDAAYEPKK